MKLSTIFAIGAILPAVVSASEFSVKVYDGPTECDGVNIRKVETGDIVSIHYVGTIDESSATGEKGKKFDANKDRGWEPFETAIGLGKVIKGWDEGIVGLCKGAKAILVIPPEMGYGDTGAGKIIPGGATLNFDVEIAFIIKKPKGLVGKMFDKIDTNNNNELTLDEMKVFFKDADADELMESDLNKDGIITFEEFSGEGGHDEL